jgi:hypothetical protein
MIILPQANHDLKVSETGELHRPSPGYAPGALKTMTDWVHGVIDDPAHIPAMKQVGSAQPTGVLSKLIRYEKLRWFGNGTVQVALYILFLVSFLANTIAGLWCGFSSLLHRKESGALAKSNKVLSFKQATCALNLFILTAMQVVVLSVFDQIHPNCPTVLLFLPLLGTVSTLVTCTLLVVLARDRRDQSWTMARNIRGSLDVLSLILFVPYMFYWNLIGIRF